ncbi:N-acetyltransferase domain-containing protein [Favolaschia claudopus]|uniref:N-acetyltransferase domain-containing protein n=1 Tax=Favolaschia claudopus TaxID=2862362 RepID=A0AAW0CBI1_9AGAR
MSTENISIRPYQASDAPQVQAVLFNVFASGRGSVAQVAAHQFLYRIVMITSYALSGCGFALLYYLPRWNTIAGWIGVLLSFFAPGVYIWLANLVSNSMKEFCEKALAKDMRDISQHYAAPGAFFVAVREADADKKNEDAAKVKEVVGFIGLEYQPDKKTHTAEVRRLAVARKYRRRGIARQLVDKALEHAASVRGLDFVEVGMMDIHPAAKRLFKSSGWEEKNITTEWTGFGESNVYHHRRAVETKKRR